MNHALIVTSGSMALLGEEVICVITRSYVLWTDGWDESAVLKSFLQSGESRGRNGGRERLKPVSLDVLRVCVSTGCKVHDATSEGTLFSC